MKERFVLGVLLAVAAGAVAHAQEPARARRPVTVEGQSMVPERAATVVETRITTGCASTVVPKAKTKRATASRPILYFTTVLLRGCAGASRCGAFRDRHSSETRSCARRLRV